MSVNHRSHVELHTIKAEKLLFYGTNKNATHVTIASQDQRALDFENIDHVEIDDVRIKQLSNENTNDTMMSFNASNQIDLNNRTLINIATGGISASSIGSENGYTSVDNELDQLWLQKLDKNPSLGSNIVLGTNGSGVVVSTGYNSADVVRLTESQTITNKDLNESDVNISGTRGQVYGSSIGVWGNSTSSQLFYYSPSLTSNSWEYQYLDSDGKIYLKNWDDTAGTTKTNIVIYEPTQVDFKKAIIASDDIHVDDLKGITSNITMIRFTSNEIQLMEPIVLADNVIRNSNGTDRIVFEPSGTYAVKANVNYKGFAIKNPNAPGGSETGNATLHFESYGTSNCEIKTNDADFFFKRNGSTKFSIMAATGARFETDLTTTGTFNSGEITSTNDVNAVRGVFTGAVSGTTITGTGTVQGATLTSTGTIGSSGDISCGGDITVSGNNIKRSGGVDAITLGATYTTIETDLKVKGNDILNSNDATRITFATSSALTTITGDLTCTGDLTVSGNQIAFGNTETIDNNTNGTVKITATTTELTGDLKVGGNDIRDSAGNAIFNFEGNQLNAWCYSRYFNISPATNVAPEIVFYSQDTVNLMTLGTTTNNTSAGDFFITPSDGTTITFLNNGTIDTHGLQNRRTILAMDDTDYEFNFYPQTTAWVYHRNNQGNNYGPNFASNEVFSNTGSKYLSKVTSPQPSDRRLKRDITDIDVDEFDRIYNLLKPKQFYWKDEVKEKEQNYITDNGLTYGFIAQEIPEELKNWVYTDPIGYPQNNSMNFSKTVCKCCEKEFSHECCCKGDTETKEVWCNEGCSIENEDISSCECDEDGCMGMGMKSIDYAKLIPLNYIAIQRTNEKMAKLLKEEQDRNTVLEVRLQKLETMIVSIMTKLS
jgi:hypothetical protein